MLKYGLRPMTFENLLNDFFVDFPVERNYKANQTENAYSISFPLPGFEKEDLEISVEQRTLTIAYRGEETEWKNPFVRNFSLPKDSNEDAIEASLEKGILHIQVPKREEAKAKRISIL